MCDVAHESVAAQVLHVCQDSRHPTGIVSSNAYIEGSFVSELKGVSMLPPLS